MNNWTSWWSSGGKSTCQCRGHWFNFWSREDSSCLEATKPKWQLLMLKCPRAQCSVEKGATAMRGPHTTPRAQPLLAATTERAHTATQTQYRPKQTHLKEMKMEQYLDNQKCFLHVLGIRKPIIKIKEERRDLIWALSCNFPHVLCNLDLSDFVHAFCSTFHFHLYHHSSQWLNEDSFVMSL